jgi:hypothetical protein
LDLFGGEAALAPIIVVILFRMKLFSITDHAATA